MNFDKDKIKRKLLIKYPGFATIITNIKFIENDNCVSNGQPTAATEGENFIYHPEFMNSLSEEKQLFVVAHEVSHIAFNHILRSEGKDPEIWNFATDAVINSFLINDGLEMVEGGIYIDDAINYDSETLYEKLLKKKNKLNGQNKQEGNNSKQNDSNQSDGQKNNSNQNNSKDGSHDIGHDTHNMWEDTVKQRKEKQNNEQIEQEKQENSKLGERKAFRKNKNLRKDNLKKLRDSLSKKSAGYGDETSSENFQIQDIEEGVSLINWQTLLRNFINSKIDWSYKNAIIEDGVVTPHLEALPNLEIEILLDTSGSVSSQLLRNFLRECKKILGYSNIKVGCFDTKFYGFTNIKKESDIDNMELIGRGGTDFDVAVNSFTPKATCRIIFTDGDAQIPQKSMDIIWIVYGDIKIKPNGGKVIYITREQLKKMMYVNDDNIVIRKR